MATVPSSSHAKNSAVDLTYANGEEPWHRVFGLDEDPFTSEQPPFFAGGQRQENLDSLRHLVHFSSRILVVTGEPGSGKTFLLNRVLSYENEALKVIRINPVLVQDSESLLRQICKMSGLSSDNRAMPELLREIKHVFLKRFANGFRTLLVIDDAHQLSESSLAMLIRLFNKELAEAIGLLLLAHPLIIREIHKQLAGSQSHLIHQIQLKNLNQAETAAYTEVYLTHFGWDRTNAFPPELKEKLHDAGWGIPGRINHVAPSVLLARTSKARVRSLKPLPMFVVGIAVACIATFLIVQQLRRDDKPDTIVPDQELLQTIKLELPESPAIDISEESLAALDPSIDLLTRMPGTGTDTSLAINGTQAAENSSEELLAPALSSEFAGTNSSRPADELKAKASPSQLDGKALLENSQVTDRTKIEADLSSPLSEPEQVQPESQSPPKTKTAPTSADVAEDSVQEKPYFRSMSWLRSQPRNGWTIQILGSRNEETVTKYLDQLALTANYYYVRSSYQNKVWYVILHGSYNSKDEARAALKNLPAKQRADGAWIRSLEGLLEQ